MCDSPRRTASLAGLPGTVWSNCTHQVPAISPLTSYSALVLSTLAHCHSSSWPILYAHMMKRDKFLARYVVPGIVHFIFLRRLRLLSIEMPGLLVDPAL